MSKTICLDKQWIEIQNCSKCDFCDFENEIYRCCIFDRKNNKYHSSTSAKELLGTCRLPDWDSVRDHGVDEMPDSLRYVRINCEVIETKKVFSLIANYKNRWKIDSFDREMFEFGLKNNKFKIISWQELPENWK